ncbi:MAG: amidohydrolase family protein [Verrucomicrobia bacterium]|nr:amidohydrolase family protein [Verrucomicrobiota bacterium]
MRRFLPFLAAGLAAFALRPWLHSQTTSAPPEDLREAPSRVHALVGARAVTAPGKVVENATVVLRDGLIESVAAGAPPPPDARVWDLKGRTLYAGFIESETGVGLPEEYRAQPPRSPRPSAPAIRRGGGRRAPAPPVKQPAEPGGGVSWNPHVTPQRSAAELIVSDEKSVEKLRALGFTAAVVTPGRGIFRGSDALLQLGGREPARSILPSRRAQHIAFEQSAFGSDVYPNSLMGSIALIRQTLLDAQWHAAARQFVAAQPGSERPEENRALQALEAAVGGKGWVVLATDDELDHRRALRLVEEFKLNALLRGNGFEYRSLAALAAAKPALILPLNFPEAPEVESPEKAVDVPLDELEHWQEAPANPGRLAKAGLKFAFTTAGLEKPEKFWSRLREAVQRGLSADDALAALTTHPAGMWGAEDRLGTIEKGRLANLVVASGDLFKDEEAVVLATWVDGEPFETDRARERDVRGTYALSVAGFPEARLTFKIEGEPGRPRIVFGERDNAIALQQGGRISFAPTTRQLPGLGGEAGVVRFTFDVPRGAGETIGGGGQLPDGREFTWTATRTAAWVKPPPRDQKDRATKDIPLVPVPEAYPAGSFGLTKADLAAPDAVLIKGGTVWTSGPQGILTGADVLIEKGRIKAVGKGLTAPAGARVIDATGKHVTPGIIDCHSHTAISRGVNEGASVVTCEVRIGDVLDPTDIGLYRQLAGGLTTANVLHGSANPIGGQNQVIKLRWGLDADGLRFAGAPAGVKFALGENPKSSNFPGPPKYPNTRMGVEQILRDTFLGARDLTRRQEAFKAAKAGTLPPVRRNLRLEAAQEMLRGERLIHCHSYRQDEILATMRLAEEFGITIATFQHILEGYKVAAEMAKHGVGGSSFADWWNYKLEAADAIPYNPAILVRAGVLTSVNSDSADLARRLNTEAAKAVRYGGLTEEQALKLVTLWPAQQLRIDRQVGSLEPGKDADFVIWDTSPLSSYAKAEQTWIDGRCYFELGRDRRLREAAAKRREALVQRALPDRLKALAAMAGGPGGQPGAGGEAEKKPELSAFEALLERAQEHRLRHWEREQRGLYHDGGDAHNCSSHGG